MVDEFIVIIPNEVIRRFEKLDWWVEMGIERFELSTKEEL